MDRDAMLKRVETLYEGRRTGDMSKFDEVLAEGATFRFAGESSIVAEFPGGETQEPQEVAQALFDQIEMLERRCVSAIAEGNKLAVHFATILRVHGGEPFEQELFDLWEFDEDGRITHGSQFQDTAKIINEMHKVR